MDMKDTDDDYQPENYPIKYFPRIEDMTRVTRDADGQIIEIEPVKPSLQSKLEAGESSKK